MTQAAELSQSRHLVAMIGGQEPGPTLVAVGGIHGNEPAGVQALKRVVENLRRSSVPFRGRLIALTGNVEALSEGRRFIQKDLNRIWTPANIREVSLLDPTANREYEDRNQWELLGLLQQIRKWPSEKLYLVDLHTTSAPGVPFCVLNDKLENREFASRFSLPLVLGLEEELSGTMADFFDRNGHVSCGFEGGQHESALAVDFLEAIVWVALASAGNVLDSHCPAVGRSRQRLGEVSRGLPSIIEVQHRHPVGPEDRFRMEPGFSNLQRVASGEILARDRDREYRAPFRACLLMPLYQEEGEDGFFLAQEVKPFWLKVSAWVRRRSLERFVHWLPGVSPHPLEEGVFTVNTRVARWLALQFFHLLGFRKQLSRDGRLLVRRRT